MNNIVSKILLGVCDGRRVKKMLIGRRSKMPLIAQGQLIIARSQLHICILWSIFNKKGWSKPAASSVFFCLHSKIFF